jgi:hypothetical protein
MVIIVDLTVRIAQIIFVIAKTLLSILTVLWNCLVLLIVITKVGVIQQAYVIVMEAIMDLIVSLSLIVLIIALVLLKEFV